MGPEGGISTFLQRVRMVSMVVRLGESPPWTQNISPSMTAARGRQSKVSVKQFQTLWLPYFLATSSQKPQTVEMFLDQWLPLNSTTSSGYFSLYRNSSRMVSTELQPRSTQSPRKMQRYSGIRPPLWNNYSRSQNCPCTSPQTVTGACTGCTFDYSNSKALTLRHRIRTSSSGMILHSSTVSINSSRFFINYTQTSNEAILEWLLTGSLQVGFLWDLGC